MLSYQAESNLWTNAFGKCLEGKAEPILFINYMVQSFFLGGAWVTYLLISDRVMNIVWKTPNLLLEFGTEAS